MICLSETEDILKTARKQRTAARGGKGASRKTSYDTFDFGDDRRSRYLSGVEIDFKNGELLKKFMTEHGKLLPRRITGASAAQQRQLKRAVRRARIIGLVR